MWQGDEHMSDPLDRARSISNVDEAARLYAEWAPTYDDDVFSGLGFTGSARIAELLAGVLGRPIRVSQVGVAQVVGTSPPPSGVAGGTRENNVTISSTSVAPFMRMSTRLSH